MNQVTQTYVSEGGAYCVTFLKEDGFIPKDAVYLGGVMMAETDGTRRKIKIAIEGGEFSIEYKDTVAFEKWVRQACRDKGLQARLYGEDLKDADPRRFNPSMHYKSLGWGFRNNNA